MSRPGPADLIASDRWTLLEWATDLGPALLRLRQPLLGPGGTGPYSKCLRIVWAYFEPDTGALPSDPQSLEMAQFENVVVAALEHDGLAVLTAVLTFDGARQWVFYTPDVKGCGARLNALPPTSQPYPIQLDAFADPDWDYLRNDVAGGASI